MELPKELEYKIFEYSSEINKLVILSKSHNKNLIKDERYIHYKVRYYYNMIKLRVTSMFNKLSTWWTSDHI